MEETRRCRRLWESVNGIEDTPGRCLLGRNSRRVVWEKGEEVGCGWEPDEGKNGGTRGRGEGAAREALGYANLQTVRRESNLLEVGEETLMTGT